MATAEELITENIDLWTGAIKRKSGVGRGKGSSKKIELYGVKKLRELILEMAVRGLLVPQDASDEPASVLLERIAAEKARLVKEKKTKKQKASLSIVKEDIPFTLPASWEWTRLGDVGVGATGKTPSTKKAEFFEGNIPFIGPGQITPSGQLLCPDKFLSESGVENSEEAIVGDLLMVCIGGSIGKSAISDKRQAFNQQINSIRPVIVLSKYLYIAITTNTFYTAILDSATGSATPIINRSRWEALLVPVCPEAEQHRIVAKVDELMALCDQLEQQTETNISAHETLVEALLQAITRSDSSANSAESIELLFANFDSLFTTEECVDQLKQTILQLAVMGKLVPQDPSDEPASVLLEKIAAEKEKLVKEKKIKKQKALPPIGDEEKPFDLPVGWELVRLQSLVTLLGDGLHGTPNYDDSGSHFFVNGNNLNAGSIEIKPETKKVSVEEYEKYKKDLNNRTVLISINGTLGKVAFYNDEPIMLGKSACYFNLGLSISKAFIKVIIESPYFVNYAFTNATGSIIKNLGLKTMNNFPLILPPLDEQHRIVERVDELMILCDQLKAQITSSQTIQLHLADTVTEQVIA